MDAIFDDFERKDPSPALHTADSFSFLNRAAKPEWQQVRELVDTWYRNYPKASQADLRSRFRDSDAAQHYGAWWELYIYTLCRRLGYDVIIHPTLSTTTRQPDFLVSRGDTAMYVECVVAITRAGAISGDGRGERSWIFDVTNEARNPNFMVDIETPRSGPERPKKAEIIRPLEEWLSSLDPDEVSERISAGEGTPTFVLEIRGWTIEYSARPVMPDRRGQPGRLIAIYPAIIGDINGETMRLRNMIKQKGGHYGQPDHPFVVAVLNTSGFSAEDEVTEALFGTEAVQHYEGQADSVHKVRLRDGYWRQGPPKRGSRVSAVLFGQDIYPWRVTDVLPQLWLNPWANLTLTPQLPLRTLTAHDTGAVYEVRGGSEPGSIFAPS